MPLASPVVEAWSESNTLMARAISGRLALTPNANISRGDLVCNDEVLIPILKHQGLRTTLDMIAEEVEMFMAYARPKGKPALSRPSTEIIGGKEVYICSTHVLILNLRYIFGSYTLCCFGPKVPNADVKLGRSSG